jgi:beta-1,4-mannosyltransferase
MLGSALPRAYAHWASVCGSAPSPSASGNPPDRAWADGRGASTVGEMPRIGLASFPSVLATNPYQRLLYAELEKLGIPVEPRARFDLGWLLRARRRVRYLHFHWPQGFYRLAWAPRVLAPLGLALFALRLLAARLLGYRIAWTVHQPRPHESGGARVDRTGHRLLARASHVLLAHDRATADATERELGIPASRLKVVPHGSYVGVYPPGRPREVVRAELGIPEEAFAFLCFGDLRAYKAVELLLAGFASASLPAAVLVVAGSPRSAADAEAVRGAAATDDRIRPLLAFIPDERVAELFGACDAGVLPRSDGGTSGALVLALSLGLPPVAARLPAYEELTGGEEEAGWLFDPGDAASLGRALERAARDPAEARAKGAAALERARGLRWSEIGAQTAALLDGGRNRRKPSRTRVVRPMRPS